MAVALALGWLAVSAGAQPAAGALHSGLGFVERMEAWLAGLVPSWASAAAEPPVAEPPPEGIAFDDFGGENMQCGSETCPEGEKLPDFDPNG